ncbi:MAG: sugar transferase [Nonlabens sp.]
MELIVAVIAVVILAPVIMIGWVLAAISTGSNGWFLQERVGRYGKTFKIHKLRTMNDGRVTGIGAILRKTKLDELPQLLNVITGDMSIVGPRPDIPGYYDLLQGEDRRLLELRPGLTSGAAIKYRNEEALLAAQDDPILYNDTILFPDKVAMNIEYMNKRSIATDFKIILQTVISIF